MSSVASQAVDRRVLAVQDYRYIDKIIEDLRMRSDNYLQLKENKTRIAGRVRALRKDRRWTQAELAEHLHLSQNRLSEIERGGGSFTAEQFLAILKLFNIPVTHFAAARRRDMELQNALAR